MIWGTPEAADGDSIDLCPLAADMIITETINSITIIVHDSHTKVGEEKANG